VLLGADSKKRISLQARPYSKPAKNADQE